MTSAATRPHIPPRTFDDLGPNSATAGPRPGGLPRRRDPPVCPSGSGHHRYVKMRKRCWTTPNMVSAIARAANVDTRDIGYAGMKDRHAITTQWVSLPAAVVHPTRGSSR